MRINGRAILRVPWKKFVGALTLTLLPWNRACILLARHADNLDGDTLRRVADALFRREFFALALKLYLMSLLFSNFEQQISSCRVFVAIAGPPRVGKTIVSRLVGEKLGWPVVHLDKLERMFAKLPLEKAKWAKDRTVRLVLSAPVSKCIIEGGLWVRWPKPFGHDDNEFSIDDMLELCKHSHLRFFALGCSDCEPKKKADGIVSFGKNGGCWVEKRGVDPLRLAGNIIESSKKIRDGLRTSPENYLEVPCSPGQEDFLTLASFIRDAVVEKARVCSRSSLNGLDRTSIRSGRLK